MNFSVLFICREIDMKSDVNIAQGLVEGGKQFFRNREKVTNVTKVASVLGTFTKFLKAARPLFNALVASLSF